MGSFNFNSGMIQNFNVQLVTETGGNIVVHLEIITDINVTKFRISSDTRCPDINDIANKLQQGLQASMNTNTPFGIDEYSDRMYIFVNYPDGSTEQYTGSRR